MNKINTSYLIFLSYYTMFPNLFSITLSPQISRNMRCILLRNHENSADCCIYCWTINLFTVTVTYAIVAAAHYTHYLVTLAPYLISSCIRLYTILPNFTFLASNAKRYGNVSKLSKFSISLGKGPIWSQLPYWTSNIP